MLFAACSFVHIPGACLLATRVSGVDPAVHQRYLPTYYLDKYSFRYSRPPLESQCLFCFWRVLRCRQSSGLLNKLVKIDASECNVTRRRR